MFLKVRILRDEFLHDVDLAFLGVFDTRTQEMQMSSKISCIRMFEDDVCSYLPIPEVQVSLEMGPNSDRLKTVDPGIEEVVAWPENFLRFVGDSVSISRAKS